MTVSPPMPTIAELQEALHPEGHGYAAEAPHIKHRDLHDRVVATVQHLVGEIIDRKGECRVLEIGAGHGTFTDHIVAAGARVTVTEMSAPSAAELSRRFRNNADVEVTLERGPHDATTTAADLVVVISVLHHIPDYVAAVGPLIERILPGGAFVSFQDPLWYPRRSWFALRLERLAYLTWRVPRGDLRRGLATVARRLRGVYDESNPSDMVEYHVVRDGVDEQALSDLLAPAFADVEVTRYWSTQSTPMQWVGERLFPPNTFGLVARDRHGA